MPVGAVREILLSYVSVTRLASATLAATLAFGCALNPDQRNHYRFSPSFAIEDPQFRRSLDNVGSVMVAGNDATLLENGDGIFGRMLEDIQQARKTINIEIYIYMNDEAGRLFTDALIEAARRGVSVRLLADAQGSKLGPLRDEMIAAGVHCRSYRPAPGYAIYGRRTHRKIVVVDGQIGYTGGFCIDKRWLGNARDKSEWHDSAARVSGPVVAQMQAIFSEDWTFTTGEILAGDDFYPKLEPAGTMQAQAIKSSKGDASSLPKMLYFMAIQAAKTSIHIQNAYFLPDEQIRNALVAAAGRGVDVKVLVPGSKNDVALVRLASQHYYGALLKGGVRIFEYQPTMLHDKNLIVDGMFATIGSINLDVRSMSKNAEVSLSFYDRGFATLMEEMFARNLADCREISYDSWKKRGSTKKFAEAMSHMFEPYY
jgi:cardiolipin synthase